MLETIAVFLPLLGSFIAGCLAFAAPEDEAGRAKIDAAAQWLTSGALILAAVCAGFVYWDVVIGQRPHTTELFTWIYSGALEVSWAIKMDTLSSVMLFMVTTVSSVIH